MTPAPELPSAFAPLFGAGNPYLSFLHVVGAHEAVGLLRAAIEASPDLDGDLRALLRGANWRPHLVAAAAMVAVGRGPIDAVWERILGEHRPGVAPLDGGSWVVPQLAGAASVIDPDYALTARLHLMRILDSVDHIDDGHWALVPVGKGATALAAFLDHPPPDARFARLVHADAKGDKGGELATGWLRKLRAALEAPAWRMRLRIVDGDLLDQDVDVLVNAWNRNVIPWWLLLPQGVSGAIKRRAGYAPFQELGWAPMPLGSARLTSAGRLPHRAIIHVAGIDMAWRASVTSVSASVESAIALAEEHGFRSIAFPILGAGSGGFPEAEAERVLRETLERLDPPLDVVIVRWRQA